MGFLRRLSSGSRYTPEITGGAAAAVLLFTQAFAAPGAAPPAAKPGPAAAAKPAPGGAGKAPVKPAPGGASKAPIKAPVKAPVTPPGAITTTKVSCQGSEGQVVLTPAEGEIKCNEEFEDCEGKFELSATNCTGEFQSFYKLEIFEGGRCQQVLEFDPAGIASPGGGRWKESVPWSTPGELEAVVYYHPPGQSGDFSARGPLKVLNRALQAAKDACVKCEGTWGRYGVNKYQSCNCKMPDAGKTCYDGDECQGLCLFRRYDSDAREEGECSETQRVQGCVGIILKGQSKVEPRRPPPRKQSTCFD